MARGFCNQLCMPIKSKVFLFSSMKKYSYNFIKDVGIRKFSKPPLPLTSILFHLLGSTLKRKEPFSNDLVSDMLEM